jgi:diaminopimelate epimerase
VPTIRDIPFVKYHAAGNDFIVISADVSLRESGCATRSQGLAAFASSILARHTGVGADGLFVVWPAADSKHHAAVKIFNSDGSEAEMSGNGIRCAAAWLIEARPRLKQVQIETAAGVKTADVAGMRGAEMLLRVAMGEPILDPARIPFLGGVAVTPVVRYPLPLASGLREVSVTSMGNPHCSTFVDSFDDVDWRCLGCEIERHALFPNRTNVEFVRVLSRNRIEVRFWERGVGETLSSGTGSCAATVASVLNGFTARKVTVKTAGGELKVEWRESNEIFLTGPVQSIAKGKFEYHEKLSASKTARGRKRLGAS